jgi:hypothetical protein
VIHRGSFGVRARLVHDAVTSAHLSVDLASHGTLEAMTRRAMSVDTS